MFTEYPAALQTPEYRRAISDLAAGLAHEVRNPLSLAKANLDVLERDGANPEARFGAIRRELERINDIMSEFIAFSRHEPSRKAAFDMKAAAEELAGDFARVYPDIAFNVSASGQTSAFGDRAQLARVLMNLIKNAVESIRQAGGRGRVDIGMDGGEPLILRVTDDGAGLGGADAGRLAKPFYTTKQGGTGLGLYVCSQILAEHGGSLSLREGDGGGAVAELVLPRSVGQEGLGLAD